MSTKGWEFISSKVIGGDGEAGEIKIWESVKSALLQRKGEGIAILNYTSYNHTNRSRVQPDILIVSRESGLCVVEVKTCRIDQIKEIKGNQWEMNNFYTRFINPGGQAENQLRKILWRFGRYPKLKELVTAQFLIALPLITREDWKAREFEVAHHTMPPIIFGDQLRPHSINNSIDNDGIIIEKGKTPFIRGEAEWGEIRNAILGGPNKSNVKAIPNTSTPSDNHTKNPQNLTRGEILQRKRNQIKTFDIQQAEVAMQIPPGPQRIRGIAGSGKTILLCQKAALMHLAHPEWDIALIFFTQSLYDLIPQTIDYWLRYLSEGEKTLDNSKPKLMILHAWGSKEKLGFYKLMRDRANVNAIVEKPAQGNPVEKLAAGCRRLLNNNLIDKAFDAILIDEGQDLTVSEEYNYDNKQPIYWLAWESLRPVNDSNNNSKRLIWAYDECQSLDSLKTPQYSEIFGNELGRMLSGKNSGPNYKGGIKKNIVLKCCYRTPGPIIVAAHALGMGLLRAQGMISGLTTKDQWKEIGYNVRQGDFRRPGSQIILSRPSENSPNGIPVISRYEQIEFNVYNNRDEQLKDIVAKVKCNIESEGMMPNKDILIITIGNSSPADTTINNIALDICTYSGSLQHQVANTLLLNGLNYYLPGAHNKNRFIENDQKFADKFWLDDSITVSQLNRAKGHEAPIVYILGLEWLANNEEDIFLRNQLFVALSRSTAWINLSGLKDPKTNEDYLLYHEIHNVIKSGETLRFNFIRPPKRVIDDSEAVIATG